MEVWQEWRFCVVCHSKFLATIQILKYDYQVQEDGAKVPIFFVCCPVCDSPNVLDESIVPATEQDSVKKAFYAEKSNERKGMTS